MNRLSDTEALFLPFLQIPSGHHHVADTLMTEYNQVYPQKRSIKLDLLAYSYGNLEAVVSSIYTNWIKYFPDSYDRLYQQLAFKKATKRTRHFHYELLFRPFLDKLIKDTNPEILFFTHALPSNMASVLKQKKKLSAITVNVYTDFFINRLWGINGIDFHFVPSVSVRDFLIRLGVREDAIFVTGIPVHPVFHQSRVQTAFRQSLLVTGGSLGTGRMNELLSSGNLPTQWHLYILCGQNRQLYQHLLQKQLPMITPIPYIESKQEMNELYQKVDAVITKPGGVTISECLIKKKPIFIYNALPGQEKINVQELSQLGLIHQLGEEALETQINRYFMEGNDSYFMNQLKRYDEERINQTIGELIQRIMNS
ncbi:MGDG synthase family glycosyltransferase [Virgibacillus salexigens]|uniref:Glycosyltransferase YkoN n=1 Tax=Virgibacillus kapii TaxID=1638645 RepID=A0ABQ2DM22_9BACI|nr:glycosyltransferase [Virgibacillus kapii]GGJ60816.1 putative glycosyltransferase YkoN [Virgibacillus kapii]